MIKAVIKDVLKIDRVELEIDPCAVLAGPNEAGKTSIIEAIGAAAAGNAFVRGVTTKGLLGAIVRRGAAAGFVVLEGPDGSVRMDWPGGELTTVKRPPAALPEVVGLNPLLRVASKKRAQRLIELLDAQPSFVDLQTELQDAKVMGASETVWKKIEQEGWDLAWTAAKERGARLKGQWEQVTGENYGSAKAPKWLPDAWETSFDTTSLDKLREAHVEARKNLEAVIAAQAVSADELRQLKEQADRVKYLETRQAEAEEKVTALNRQVTEAETERGKIPSVEQPAEGIPCPYEECCKVQRKIVVRVASGRVDLEVPGKRIPEDELKERRLQIAGLDGKISKLRADLATATAGLSELTGQLHAALRAAEKLKKLPPDQADEAAVDAAREATRLAELRVSAFERKQLADQKHKAVQTNQVVIDVLAPDGVRRRKLREALVAFSADHLIPLSRAAGLRGELTIDADMTPKLGDEPYAFLSAGAQRLCDAVFQIALAKKQGCDLVVIDNGNECDEKNGSALLRLCAGAGLPLVLAFATTRRDKIPKLHEKGRGKTYWVENGKAELA